MSRFNNLEFGGGSEPAWEVPAQRQALKDEQSYATEAQTAFESGRFETALRGYGKVIEHNPRNSAAWAGQVRMLIELGEFIEARLWADKAISLFPDEPDLLAVKAVALARSGDSEAALCYSDSAIQANGGGAYVWLARADVLLARQERRADFCIEKAIQTAPLDWCVHWLASRILAFHKQFARALKLVQAALALDPTRAVVWLEAGMCQTQLGLVALASHSFAQARQLDPDCRPAEDTALQLSGISLWTRLRGRWRRIFQT
jgi:tetratricopeptide (TPR) repeat protein